MTADAADLLRRVSRDLAAAEIDAVEAIPAAPPPLPSRLAVADLAAASVAAASAVAASLAGVAAVPGDPERVAVAYSSERWFRLDGDRPDAFAPLSGFFRTSDGWVRTHGNYPHHAAVLRRVLGLPDDADADDATTAFASRRASEVSAAVAGAGGLCVVVARADDDVDAALRAGPLLRVSRLGDAPLRPLPSPSATAPLRGIRVLDLTRVIAGPVGTRTLALLGADVLRIDPPRIPEIAWQHLDTGHGKRSTLLDVGSPAGRSRFDELLAGADVVALGYRAAGLDRLGLTPERLAAARPGIVVARHSAWGDSDRRGFDSLVQAASGIALVESADRDRPGALPAQALDHSAGYLLAAGVMALLRRRAREGGSWLVETSLRRIAAELLGMPRITAPLAAEPVTDPAEHVQTFDIAGSSVTTAAPAVGYAGGPTAFRPPRPWGQDEPSWLD